MINIEIQNPLNNSVLFVNNLQIKYNVTGLDKNVKSFVFLVNEKKYNLSDYYGSFSSEFLLEGKNEIIAYAINKNNKKLEYTEKKIVFTIYNLNISSKTNLSLLTKSIIPEFITSDYSLFTTFIQKYYQFLQDSNTPYLIPFKQSDFLDIDTTSSFFFPYFHSQFLPDFPFSLFSNLEEKSCFDVSKFVKNIKKFYESKGTLNSYKFLFRTLFNVKLDIEYPREKILKASSGKWSQKISIKIFCYEEDLTNLNNKFVYQVDSLGNRTASAKVKFAKIYFIEQYKIAELFLENYVGFFSSAKKLLTDIVIDGSKETLKFTPALIPSKINVEQKGFNYKVNDRVYLIPKKFVDIDGRFFSGEINFDYIIDNLNVNTNFNSFYYIFNGENFSSQFLGNSVDSYGRGYVGFVSKVGKNGEILQIDSLHFGFNYEFNIDQFYDVVVETEKGTGFFGYGQSGVISEYFEYYEGNDGKLSSNRVLQDNDYYQSHSYQINTEIDISLYQDTVLKLVHPSGYKLFGQNIINKNNKLNSLSSFTVQILNG